MKLCLFHSKTAHKATENQKLHGIHKLTYRMFNILFDIQQSIQYGKCIIMTARHEINHTVQPLVKANRQHMITTSYLKEALFKVCDRHTNNPLIVKNNYLKKVIS